VLYPQVPTTETTLPDRRQHRDLHEALEQATDLLVTEIIDMLRGATLGDLVEAIATENPTVIEPVKEQKAKARREPVSTAPQPQSTPEDDLGPAPTAGPPQELATEVEEEVVKEVVAATAEG